MMKNINTPTQQQTEETFGFKWKKRDTYESSAVQKEWQRWLFEKYLDNQPERLNKLLPSSDSGRSSILDAGCGAGLSAELFFGEHLKRNDYLGVDISEAALVARSRFEEKGIPGRFEQCDLTSIPDHYGMFDLIFSEGVLHHTDSVENAILQLSKRLKQNGKFLFYVYAKKAPVREFTDDLIRDAIAPLNNEQAWSALQGLTKLGKALGDLNIEIEIDEAIPFLGIEKGKHNLQRLFYYKICKAYYQPDYTIEEMNHINFDWFRPQNCFRHTPEEIKTFCTNAGLSIERMHVEESGITVIAKK